MLLFLLFLATDVPSTAAEVSAFRERFDRAPAAESFEGAVARAAAVDVYARGFMTTAAKNGGASNANPDFCAARAAVHEVDRENLKLVTQLVASGAWSRTRNLRFRQNAWLLIQHTPDTEAQKAALKQLEPFNPGGPVPGESYALLFDRIALREARPQRYGTQLECREGRYVIAPTEDPGGLDARRRRMGFTMALKEYVALHSAMSCGS